MAGDWIKMRTNLAEDPAVIAIAAKLGKDEHDVVGRLHAIWSWADGQSRDGHAPGVTHAFLDRKVRCDGFAQAMCEVRWLSIDPTGVTFPNFEVHNGKTAKERALGSKRQKQHRENVTPTVTADVTAASRTERDKDVTREEKRREEEKKATAAMPPADWIPAEAWADFVAHRKAKRAPLTERAVKLIVRDLEKFRAQGVSPAAVLEFAIKNGHTGLYFKPDPREPTQQNRDGLGTHRAADVRF